MAYAHRFIGSASKVLIGLHTDSRAAFMDSKLNPMLKVPLDQIVTFEEDLLSALEEVRAK